ncbi:MAG: alpha/beta hydrolase [Actinomycetota bacterium]|nr:alpha/beta hydrolase [Actinomycetota bacterium]
MTTDLPTSAPDAAAAPADHAPAAPAARATPALRDDPRVDPRLVAAMEPLGLAGPLPPSRLDASTPLEKIRSALDRLEAGSSTMNALAVDGLDPVVGVERSTVTVAAPAGHEITVYLHRPDGVTGPLPAVLHLHGGGGVMMTAADDHYVRWRDELATHGVVVAGVEFRNGAGRLGAHPFPAGLDDCATALGWLHEQRAVLGVSSVVVSGDSGGGNLALATALRAKREGVSERIDGVYALCPYISNAYAAPPDELPSLRDNDGYLVSVALLGAMAKAYTPDPDDARSGLAWPLLIDDDELVGLPPHVVSVNELDPLRDEGLTYYRRLLAAGVPARARTLNGTVHAAESNYFAVIPDVARATLADIAWFARSL